MEEQQDEPHVWHSHIAYAAKIFEQARKIMYWYCSMVRVDECGRGYDYYTRKMMPPFRGHGFTIQKNMLRIFLFKLQ
jgi:hypothetical protein